jgi:hypothetical protein
MGTFTAPSQTYPILRGTEGSNPLPSSGESRANSTQGFGDRLLPQGDLDDGAVGQLLEKLAREMDRSLGQEEAHIGV